MTELATNPYLKDRIFLVIPAYNEEECLPLVLQAIDDLDIPLEEVVLVDNASTDTTPQIAREYGATVVSELQRGYGAACLRGLEYIRANKTPEPNDIVVFLDADYSDYPEDINRLLDKLYSQEAEFVVGSRLSDTTSRGAVPPVARFGNTFAMTILYLMYRKRYTDMGPFRAIRWSALESLEMCDRTWGWTLEMQLKAAKLGVASTEVPVRYRSRYSGKSKISQSIPGALRAGTKILWVLGRHVLWRQ